MRDFDRDALAAALEAVDPDLSALAWDVLGAVHRIDAVAVDASGGAHVVFFCDAPDDGAVLTRALAAIAWLEPRLADWAQLARHAGLDPSRPVRAMLVAREFEPDTLAAARWIGGERVRCLPARGAEPALARPPARQPDASPPLAGSAPARLASAPTPATLERNSAPLRATSRFRTRLSESDLGAGEATGRGTS